MDTRNADDRRYLLNLLFPSFGPRALDAQHSILLTPRTVDDVNDLSATYLNTLVRVVQSYERLISAAATLEDWDQASRLETDFRKVLVGNVNCVESLCRHFWHHGNNDLIHFVSRYCGGR